MSNSSNNQLSNPILTGFNPDPSIVRVGEDYYIATSTFEWFPGVQIHHSRDLVNWTLVARPLDRLSQLDMLGVPDSGGVWAPCLTHHEGTFYLVYSNVKSFQGFWKDSPNYVVTTNDILGDWSEPVYLNAYGFDPSLFHDEDGKKYFLSMLVDHRQGRLFGGIVLQEYDDASGSLVGPIHYIFEGTELGNTEGPHLYRMNGYYYLLLAEGGTEYGHAMSVARSKNILGPYELHPENPIVTARTTPEAFFQRTGHGDWVETADGDWYLVCLAGRPLQENRRCILGRETVMEEMIWKEDWPYLKNETRLIRQEVPVNNFPNTEVQLVKKAPKLSKIPFGPDFQSLRIPIASDWCDPNIADNTVRLYGQESLSSLHRQSLLARRLKHFQAEASVIVDIQPNTFQQMAGLVCYYNTYHWHYLHIVGGSEGKRFLEILTCDKYFISEKLEHPLELPAEGKIQLKVIWDHAELQFYYKTQDSDWQKIGPVLDASILSDDYVRDDEVRYRPAFTGAFIGFCCQDLSGQKKWADFSDWQYRGTNSSAPK